MTVIRYGSGSSEGSRRPTPMKVGFEGALSIGVDEVSNTLLISVQEELFESVKEMVERLDQQAAPDTVVRVHRVNGVSAAALRETINDALSRPWVGGRPEPGADRGGGDRGRRGEGERRGDRRDGGRRRNRDRDRDNNDNDRNRDNDNDNNRGDNDND
jgi:hypothetical protein